MPPDGKTWFSLIPAGADAFHRDLYQALDAGTAEIRQDAKGQITLHAEDIVAVLVPRRSRNTSAA